MGWFDDNHFAGEAYNFGMGYMARGRFLPDFDCDLSDFEGLGSIRCQGYTKSGTRCKITSNSRYPTARTILEHGYCTQHLPDEFRSTSSSSSSHQKPKPNQALAITASTGDVEAVKRLLPDLQSNDAVLSATPMDLNVIGLSGEMALQASSRKGHHDVVLELLCVGADPTKSLRVVDKALEELATKMKYEASEDVAFQMLKDRSKLRCVRVLLEKACELWPLPALPPLPLEPNVTAPSAESFTVDQLKVILRQHGAKVSGRKAELVERVRAGNFLEADRLKNVQEYEAAREVAISRRLSILAQTETRSQTLRQVAIDCAPQDPTEEEVATLKKESKPAQHTASGSAPACKLPNCFCNRSLFPAPPRILPQLMASYNMRARDRSRSPRGRSGQPVCTHFLRVSCHFGFHCRFSHERERNQDYVDDSPVCCYFLQGKCRFGPECDFSHDRSGKGCQFGESCWFDHGS